MTSNIFKVSSRNKSELEKTGYVVLNAFLDVDECQAILKLIDSFRKQHTLSKINRPCKERSLKYWVINGTQISEHLPDVWRLYQNVNCVVNNIGVRNLAPLKDQLPAVNINIMNPGGEYRWHYDRNAVTALLYLNEVENGELELYPNYRVRISKSKFSSRQKHLDTLLKSKIVRNTLSQKISIKPCPGMMVIMRGDRCLHSVSPLKGEQERMNIVMAYDTSEAQFPIETELNSYLYTNQVAIPQDANYLRKRAM